MGKLQGTPSTHYGRRTIEDPPQNGAISSTAESPSFNPIGMSGLYPDRCRLLFLHANVSAQAPEGGIYVLVFDAVGPAGLQPPWLQAPLVGGRPGVVMPYQLPLFDPGLLLPGQRWTFSEPQVESFPDGFPLDYGLFVVASTTPYFDAESVVGSAMKLTARIDVDDCRTAGLIERFGKSLDEIVRAITGRK